jgi:hypothetical protein
VAGCRRLMERWINGGDEDRIRVSDCQGGAAPTRLEGTWGQRWFGDDAKGAGCQRRVGRRRAVAR